MSLYSNRISTKEAENMSLQTSMSNLQEELKNLKAEIYNIKKPVHSGAAGAANKDNRRMVPNWKREGQYHHPT